MSSEKKILLTFLDWCYSILQLPKGDVRIRYYEKIYDKMI